MSKKYSQNLKMETDSSNAASASTGLNTFQGRILCSASAIINFVMYVVNHGLMTSAKVYDIINYI